MFPHCDWEDDRAKYGLAPPTPYLHYLQAELEKLVNRRVSRDEWNQRRLEFKQWRRDLIHLGAIERQLNKDGYDAYQVSILASRHELRMPPWAGELLAKIEAEYSKGEEMNLDAVLGFRGSRTQNEKKPNKKEGRRARDIYATALEALCREVWGLKLLAVPIKEACTMVTLRAKKERRGEGLLFRVPHLNADSLRAQYYRWKKWQASMLTVTEAEEATAKDYLEKNRDKHLAQYRA